MKCNKLLQIAVFCTLTLIFFTSICLAGFFKVAGASMEPTLKSGKRIWVSGYAKNAGPERGDIIVYKFERMAMLKRVIGLPLEKVVIKDGAVFIVNQANHEQKLDEPYLTPGTVTQPDGEFSVPEGAYFVLGDNRNASRDSRDATMGCIPRKNIVGKMK